MKYKFHDGSKLYYSDLQSEKIYQPPTLQQLESATTWERVQDAA